MIILYDRYAHFVVETWKGYDKTKKTFDITKQSKELVDYIISKGESNIQLCYIYFEDDYTDDMVTKQPITLSNLHKCKHVKEEIVYALKMLMCMSQWLEEKETFDVNKYFEEIDNETNDL